MAKTCPLDKFSSEIAKILAEYENDVDKHLSEITKQVAKKGAKAVKSGAKVFNGKQYASGWSSKVEEKRLYTQAVIYNKKQPGLPHLLEYGHALRGGGRTSGVAHIKPVEEKIIEEFENEVKIRL